MKRLLKYSALLRFLNDSKTRRCIIKKCDKEFLLCIADICQNILSQNVNITKQEKNKLKPYKKVLRSLAKMTRTGEIRRLLLNHNTKFLIPCVTAVKRFLKNV